MTGPAQRTSAWGTPGRRSTTGQPPRDKERNLMSTTAAVTAEDPLASSGHCYPQAAKGKVQAYWWHLNALRASRTRAETAAHAWKLASAAQGVAAALPTADEAARGTWADPRAWHSLSVHLARLAIALDGDPVKVPDGWADLSAARTRAEFTAAWHPVSQNLRRRDPPLPTFAVAQVAMAAAAVTGAPW